MKAFIIILAVLISIFLVIQIFAMRSQKGIEQYPYKLIEKYSDIEIRKYESSLFTSVELPTNDYKIASSKGFSILAGYIFGGNDKKEKIAMTSPVSISLDDSMTMMFMVPRDLKKDNLPTPDQSQIEFKVIPEKSMAAITFGGWANADKIESHKEKLIAALDREGITYINKFYFFGYNPPYEIINRKNEIVVELQNI